MNQLPCSTFELLERRANGADRHRIAVVDRPRVATYEELHLRSRQYAAALQRAGVTRGDRVGIFLRRSIESIAALFAAWMAGGVAVIVNDALRRQQVEHILSDSGATCVLTDSRQMLAVSEFPCAVVDVEHAADGTGRAAAERTIGADLAALVYTSGSTGLPKGVMLGHDTLLSGTRIVAGYLELTSADVILSVLPFSFDYGLNQVLTAMFVGATLVIQRSLFPPDICQTMRAEGVTGLAGVPTLWAQLTGRVSPFLKTPFPTLRYLTNSGGAVPEHTVQAIRTAHPQVRIYLMYGLTEAFRSTFLPPAEIDRRPTSMGKAIPDVEILVVNDEGRPCRAGEVGELVHRGANISLGYWRDPDSTARVFRPHPFARSRNGRHEVVVYSGDLVTADEDGYLYYVGRKDMQVKARGVRVSPEEIERAVHASGLVSQAVALGVPGRDGDSEIALAVVPAGAAFDAGALDAFCRSEMPPYMWPQQIWPIAAFPLTASGKPDRPAIRRMYAEYAGKPQPAARAARTA